MDTNFAYIDETDVLHVVSSQETAEEYSANGKFVEYTGESEFGYPIVAGKKLFVYASEDEIEIFVGGNRKKGVLAKPEAYPEIMDLVNELL